MIAVILFALAYGTPNMSFPWWVWALAITCDTGTSIKVVREVSVIKANR